MPSITADFQSIVKDWEKVYHSSFFSEGLYVKKTERLCQATFGLKTLTMNSAGSALYTVARYLKAKTFTNLSRTPVAAVCCNTFFATGAMFREAGFCVSLVDCELETFSMSIESLKALPQQPDVVVLTHVGGVIAKDYEPLANYCKAEGIVLIEDASHALGANLNSRHGAGSLGMAAIYSLYATKAVPAGEGGLLMTSNDSLYEYSKRFRNYGKYIASSDGKPKSVRYTGEGFNFRMSEWDAVIAYHQIKVIKDIIAERLRVSRTLSSIISCVIDPILFNRGNGYKYPVLRDHAQQLGITRYSGAVYSETDQLKDIMENCLGHDRENLVNCEKVAKYYVCLPVEVNPCIDMDINELLKWLRRPQ